MTVGCPKWFPGLVPAYTNPNLLTSDLGLSSAKGLDCTIAQSPPCALRFGPHCVQTLTSLDSCSQVREGQGRTTESYQLSILSESNDGVTQTLLEMGFYRVMEMLLSIIAHLMEYI